MDVHNELGPGWDEWDYHRAMIEALHGKGHQVVSHDRKDLLHRGMVVDHFELDLLVDDLAVLELKHIKSNFHPTHYTQIINYQKRWNKRLGILINYGLEKLRYERVPYSRRQGSIHRSGNWERLKSEDCKAIEFAVDAINRKHGLGYGVEVYKKLLWTELEQNGAHPVNPTLAPRFGLKDFGERPVDAILINSNLMLLVSASSSDTSATDLCYLKTYMRQAEVLSGLLVNVGRSSIQLRGVM